MIFVTMGDQNRLDLVSVLNQIAEIGDDDVNPRHGFIRKCHACINYDNFVVVTKDSHVLSDFP